MFVAYAFNAAAFVCVRKLAGIGGDGFNRRAAWASANVKVARASARPHLQIDAASRGAMVIASLSLRGPATLFYLNPRLLRIDRCVSRNQRRLEINGRIRARVRPSWPEWRLRSGEGARAHEIQFDRQGACVRCPTEDTRVDARDAERADSIRE